MTGKSARSEIGLGLAMVGVIAIMVLPMPPLLLDICLSLSVSISLVVLLFSMHIERPLEFSAFPSLLLLTTLLRLALNIATTRLILLRGSQGTEAAGHVIAAFGQFVVGGNLVVGVIIFLILVVINFVVITKGSGRIGEVAARFTLDSMPGKQMAIDADLAAGLCTEGEARKRRRQVEQEADFFGAMDGAGKFVRGDAVAGLMVVAINIIGGLVVGVVQQHMPIGRALVTYTSLTVGDGLVSQIPSLLTSIAAGLVTTRAATGGALGQTVTDQLFGSRRILGLAAGVLGAMSIVPGMPHVAFLLLSATFGAIAYALPDAPAESTGGGEAVRSGPEVERAEVEAMLPLDLLEVEVGFELVPLIDTDADGSLMSRMAGLRKQIAQDLGVLIPPVHMRDNLRLEGGSYRVLLSGNLLGSGEVRMGRLLAIYQGQGTPPVPGEDVREAAFNLPARWIAAADRQRAELGNCMVVDASTALATHLGELLTGCVHELLGRRELQELLDLHGQSNARVIEELLPNMMSHGQLIRVLRNLLKERVSVRDFRSILEALADVAADVKEPDQLTELVRQRLHKQLTQRAQWQDGQVHALVLAPPIEQSFRRLTAGAGNLDAAETQRLAAAFEDAAKMHHGAAEAPVVLVAADIRRTVSTFAGRYLPTLSVLSFRELTPTAQVNTLGVIGQPAEPAADRRPLRNIGDARTHEVQHAV
jgi:flagellar biosynthesis protein FlhA